MAALKHAGIQYAIKTVELVEKSSPLQQAPLHEVLAMDSLRHSPHVAQLREYFITNDTLHIVMVLPACHMTAELCA